MSDPGSSNYSSVPVQLYRFQRGSIQYCYTACDRDIAFNNQVYKAIPMTDSGFKQSGETADDDVTVTLPWGTAIVEMFNGTAPSDEVYVTIMLFNFGERTAELAWSGTIVEVKKTNQATAEILCQTISQSFERNGLTLAYTRACPYFLYDQTTCTVNADNFRGQGIITAIDGQQVSADGFAAHGDLYYAGGYIEWLIDGSVDTYERRAIQTQVGTTVILIGLADGITTGLLVNIYPGCDRTQTTCKNKFSNLVNYGGCPFLPGMSPFDNINVF